MISLNRIKNVRNIYTQCNKWHQALLKCLNMHRPCSCSTLVHAKLIVSHYHLQTLLAVIVNWTFSQSLCSMHFTMHKKYIHWIPCIYKTWEVVLTPEIYTTLVFTFNLPPVHLLENEQYSLVSTSRHISIHVYICSLLHDICREYITHILWLFFTLLYHCTLSKTVDKHMGSC